MEGMEGVCKAVFADIFPVRGEVFSVAVHIRQNIHIIVLKQFVQFAQVWPALVMKIPVADRRHDEYAPVAQDALVTDDLRGKRLHHLDGIGTVPTTHEHIAEAFFPENIRQTGVIVRSQRIAGGTDHSARRIFEPLQLFLRKAVQPAEIPVQQAADAAHAAEDAADFFRVFLGFPDDAIGGGVQHAGGAASVNDQQSIEHGFSPVVDGIGERLKIVSRGRVWTSPLSLL